MAAANKKVRSKTIGRMEDLHESLLSELERGDDPSALPTRFARHGRQHTRMPSINSRLFDQRTRQSRPLDFLKARPSVDWSRNLSIASPFAIVAQKDVDGREEISISVPSPAGIRRRFSIQFIRDIDWSSLRRSARKWLRNPMNLALLLWLLFVAASGLMLGLLIIGLLDTAFPSQETRDDWIEINNQVLNGLFTLMSIYQHPIIFYHLFLLCRWKPADIVELRKTYCKDGSYRPNERTHMAIIIVLLQITCFAQYILCAIYWLSTSETRPEILEDIFFALGLLSPAAAGAYSVYSPLGREVDSDDDDDEDEEAGEEQQQQQQHRRLPSIQIPGHRRQKSRRRVVVNDPEWVGGTFDCGDDSTVCVLSLFCSCCVLGWNMERLGFGNMYVHIVTFILLCVAPFFILGITALKTHNLVLEDVMGTAGVLLCFLGFLYGGFWRIQMRKKFKLPKQTLCCGSGTMTDYVRWVFCWPCALAQEVRTANFYEVQDDNFYRRLMSGDWDGILRNSVDFSSYLKNPASPLPVSSSPRQVVGEFGNEEERVFVVVDPSTLAPSCTTMTAPVPPLIRLHPGGGGGEGGEDDSAPSTPLSGSSVVIRPTPDGSEEECSDIPEGDEDEEEQDLDEMPAEAPSLKYMERDVAGAGDGEEADEVSGLAAGVMGGPSSLAMAAQAEEIEGGGDQAGAVEQQRGVRSKVLRTTVSFLL